MVMDPEKLRTHGDWLDQLKKILRVKTDDLPDVDDDPKAEHRSTKAAVKVLLSNLRKGLDAKGGDRTSDEDKQKTIFNAVDLLIRDKVEKSKRGKTQLEALSKFEEVLTQELLERSQKNKKNKFDDAWTNMLKEAVQALRTEQYKKDVDALSQEEMEKVVQDSDHKHPVEVRELSLKRILSTPQGRKDLSNKPHISNAAFAFLTDPACAVDFLASISPASIDGNYSGPYLTRLGDDKNQVLGDALKIVAARPVSDDKAQAPRLARAQAAHVTALAKHMDPQEFAVLAKGWLDSVDGRKMLSDNPTVAGAILSSIDPEAIKDFDFDAAFRDDKDAILAEALVMISTKKLAKQDQTVNPAANFDPKLFTLLAKKVPEDIWNDQTATTGARKGLGARVCLELWHTQAFDQIAELIEHGVDTSLSTRVQGMEGQREGVYSGFVQPLQHIIQKYLREIPKLEQGEDLIDADEQPKIRGAQKVFEALGENAVTLTTWKDVTDSDLLTEFKDAPGTIWGFEDVRMPYVQAAHETAVGDQPLRMMELWKAIESSLSADSYDALLRDPETEADRCVELGVKKIGDDESDEYIEAFKRDAKAFLLEFAAQLPKGSFIRRDDDQNGKQQALIQMSGRKEGKFMGGLACKAGLWWAKQEKKPVYYCLDGINMSDVTNYKKVRNKAIEDFLAGDGQVHDEVITLVEIREILKNWDELSDTVKFSLKGEFLEGEDLREKIEGWKQDMERANDEAGRTPAPNYETFTASLNGIDTKLLDKLAEKADENPKQANLDARDIVKKFGYLSKIAKTRPHIAIKYVMLKCDVLSEYGLISSRLPRAAQRLARAFEKGDDEKIPPAVERLRKAIERCHESFREPLKSALLRHPETGVPL